MCEDKNFAEKFKIVHFFDTSRWSSNTADPANYAKNDYSLDIKMLAHWLAYITDRQIPFEVVWDKGAYIFSQIAENFIGSENYDITNNLKPYFKKINDKDEFVFTSNKEKIGYEQKKRLSRYYSDDDLEKLEIVTFKSRFYTDDYICILYTLSTLKEFGCSFIEFIYQVISKVVSNKNIAKYGKKDKVKYCIRGIAYFLDRLTYNPKEKEVNYFYYEDKRVTHDNLRFFIEEEFETKSNNRTSKIVNDLESEDLEKLLVEYYNKNRRYTSMKRTWCALRDYLKSSYYSKNLRDTLINKAKGELPAKIKLELDLQSQIIDVIKYLFDDKNNHKNACQWLELPGDVWNENSTFRRCITQNTKGKLGKVLREQYKSNKELGYPEEFDTTFDFVPRMCEKGNCDICPFAKYNDEKKENFNIDEIKKLCICNNEKYCPLMLLYCGYFKKCDGDNCELIKILQKDT